LKIQLDACRQTFGRPLWYKCKWSLSALADGIFDTDNTMEYSYDVIVDHLIGSEALWSP
jgi:hypothetical protein